MSLEVFTKQNFSDKIILWYETHHRDLPWRETQNPYYIWLSEVILQQTRVKQGLPYYERFVETYPTIADLANAPEDEVFRLWQGLGYYSRAKNMLHTAKIIHQEYQDKFPNTYDKLLTLKGIGKYTAAAIASFAFEEPVAVLDGNVYRVLARYFGISTDIASPQGAKEFGKLSQELLPEKKSHIYNQAIMEFGAVQCSPQKPDCMYCPLRESCYAYNHNKQQELPIKINKVKVKERFFAYTIFENNDKIALRKRTGKDIWQNLYDFHLTELDSLESLNDFMDTAWAKTDISVGKISSVYKHQLTHQKIFIKFFHIQINNSQLLSVFSKDLQFFNKDEAHELPKPILIANYLLE
ncbi:MAG: A/G-specific adenine glycosylase [Raineya sp.]|jgi:A/G-specific adenine glycosylase|nr:A/G-specific adenine glycosylase [Raineya sp.]